MISINYVYLMHCDMSVCVHNNMSCVVQPYKQQVYNSECMAPFSQAALSDES